ncbi:MAG: MgtC/SapB family protein [Paracoccus sp. (in: a-proteobacteria)]|nr:MgtC/SapB family protein [Paracoccus sp. (in: a-proteobacteria)]
MIENAWKDLAHPFVEVPFDVALLRLSAALILGAVIGWEREAARKGAGLRTHLMVSMAACLFTLVAFELVGLFDESTAVEADPLGLIGAVTSGVAFLAAGSIIVSGGKVQGLTTGAGLWLAGAIGLTCGIGRVPLAALAAFMAFVVLRVLGRFLPASDEDLPPDARQTDKT